ncbi:Tubulin-folding cofactor D [Bienertia sinuspersici]
MAAVLVARLESPCWNYSFSNPQLHFFDSFFSG